MLCYFHATPMTFSLFNACALFHLVHSSLGRYPPCCNHNAPQAQSSHEGAVHLAVAGVVSAEQGFSSSSNHITPINHPNVSTSASPTLSDGSSRTGRGVTPNGWT